MTSQTITDRLNAARHSITGQGLAKAVCKATTEEMMPPKKKHLDYLLHCTNEPNVSTPELATLLLERSQGSSWVMVFKSLITVHHLMCYGNERFTQFLASSNCNFNLENFLDKNGVCGYDMSTYIRRYARYLNEKALSYRTVAFDFCKTKRGKEGGTLRVMSADKILKTLPVLQNQIDVLLEFDCSAEEVMRNNIIMAAFVLLFRDLIRLIACYNDGIINLLEKYFEMNKKQCREGLDLYKKFLIRMDGVADILKVGERVGVDKCDIPDLTKAPSSLLEALQQHLNDLEGKRGGGASGRSKPSVVSIPTTPFKSIESATNESIRLQAIADEKEALESISSKNNPFVSAFEAEKTLPLFEKASTFDRSPVVGAEKQQSSTDTLVDLLGADFAAESKPSIQINDDLARPSDDLLLLNKNPFAEILAASNQPPTFAQPSPFMSTPTMQPNQFMSPNFFMPPSQPSSIAFGAFSSTSQSKPFDAFGQILQPSQSSVTPMANRPSASSRGEVQEKLINSDLDSSLKSLVANLNIAPIPTGSSRNMNWGGSSTKNTARTGGANFVAPVSPSSQLTPHVAPITPSSHLTGPSVVNGTSAASFDPFGAL